MQSRVARPALLLACGLCLLAPRFAQAQDEQPEPAPGHDVVVGPGIAGPPGATALTEAQFRDLPATTEPGRRFTVLYVKHEREFNGALRPYRSYLAGARPGERSCLVIQDPALLRSVRANLDSDGNRLTPRRTNIQLIGTGQRSDQGYVLVVQRVRRLESDQAYFTRQADAVAADDAPGRRALAGRIELRIRFFPDERPDLEPLLARLEREAREVERRQLPPLPGGAEARLRYASDYKEVSAAAEVWAHPEVPEAQKLEAERLLRGPLDARLYLGQWLAYSEYRARLGFGQNEVGEWVPRTRLDLQAQIGEYKKSGAAVDILPDDVLWQAGQQSKVIPGQRKDMVRLACNAYPVHVERVIEETPERQKITWEQWVMPSGLRVYFVNGRVFAKDETARAN